VAHAGHGARPEALVAGKPFEGVVLGLVASGLEGHGLISQGQKIVRELNCCTSAAIII
jgi:hypothetical protein